MDPTIGATRTTTDQGKERGNEKGREEKRGSSERFRVLNCTVTYWRVGDRGEGGRGGGEIRDDEGFKSREEREKKN
ncbi:uncharacterized protein BO95DRAFT_439366 [Aspergillus brunneoviolaceus CBS 621.78]|uniref:Uncharacterized protein n=1 Tax=Aspergillus brunneoviolaceus CBS 621.78 TaxID=1450534 RepID=A0ACD1GJP3_9EURO|nr:hypothetical protein BO95DRAFT_439366 [Aspergillus brunneoviolaceus CBS 621.78]RAH49442.1 hypothetical protein BO95DRAFT_439366 [Aspergillus brunneoviolaceus CBS 621.78]